MSEAAVPQMFTVSQVAERLHVHVQTVRLWVKNGEIGHHDIGRYHMISEDQLAQFLESRRQDVDAIS